MMFLTDEELFELTGYRRNADRCRWLSDRKWKFERNAIHGLPVVLRKHVDEMLSLDVPAASPVRPVPKLNMSWSKK